MNQGTDGGPAQPRLAHDGTDNASSDSRNPDDENPQRENSGEDGAGRRSGGSTAAQDFTQGLSLLANAARKAIASIEERDEGRHGHAAAGEVSAALAKLVEFGGRKVLELASQAAIDLTDLGPSRRNSASTHRGSSTTGQEPPASEGGKPKA